MDIIKLRFKNLESIEGVAPYLQGYLGEHVNMYPGGYQLDNGGVINKKPTILGKDSNTYREPQERKANSIVDFVDDPYTIRGSHQRYIRPRSPTSNSRYYEVDSDEDDSHNQAKRKCTSEPSTQGQLASAPSPSTSNRIASSSKGKGKSDISTEDTILDLLTRLGAGDGLYDVEYHELLGMIERCDPGCGRYFLAERLRVHIPNCHGV